MKYSISEIFSYICLVAFILLFFWFMLTQINWTRMQLLLFIGTNIITLGAISGIDWLGRRLG